ncbi:hypothetical protein [Polaribacter ponticola]|uniref:Uncharacterized protein n=1 Tax=Polaribacter ponticola TaxID=2978475 RepID=A0ABT5S6K4_9FLAO|nr:hypothetical protein [Polaribacter sp. MSW5]MDD7913734.1 hypothetical protein [Polaribacter sp. MSW5]
MKITFKLTENKEGNLSKDIEKVLKNEVSKKIDKPQTSNNKGESSF